MAELRGGNGNTFNVGKLLAVGCDAFPDADHSLCTVRNLMEDPPVYIGWHCPYCKVATSSMGHDCPNANSQGVSVPADDTEMGARAPESGAPSRAVGRESAEVGQGEDRG